MAAVAKNVRGLWARLAALRKAGPGRMKKPGRGRPGDKI